MQEAASVCNTTGVSKLMGLNNHGVVQKNVHNLVHNFLRGEGSKPDIAIQTEIKSQRSTYKQWNYSRSSCEFNPIWIDKIILTAFEYFTYRLLSLTFIPIELYWALGSLKLLPDTFCYCAHNFPGMMTDKS